MSEQTIKQFIDKYAITMTAEPIQARTDQAADQFSASAGHYICTIKTGKYSMAVPYSVGSGIILNFVKDHVKKSRSSQPVGFISGATRKEVLQIISGWQKPKTVFHAGVWEHCLKYGKANYKPDLESVLDCLASDYGCLHNSRCFEDWASEYGYDEDSRKAERIYGVVREQALQLEKLLGRHACEELVFETERL